jgi:hypothetical protein
VNHSTVLAITKLQEQTGHTVSGNEMFYVLLLVLALVIIGLLKKAFS